MGWKPRVLEKFDQHGIGDSETSHIITLPKAIIGNIVLTLFGTGGSGTPALDTDPTMIKRVKLKTDKGYVEDVTGTHLRTIARKICGTIPTVTNATGAHRIERASICGKETPRQATHV